MLADLFSRKFSYLRLSVTEVCNFKCAYCLPEGFQIPAPGLEPELGAREISNLLHGFALAGFSKVRFTGGEPTIRRDLPELIESAARTRGFQKIALSTNGWNLRRIAGDLKKAGLTHLNVSVDSLDEARFARLSGRDVLGEVLSGVEESLRLGFQAVKLNAVLHRDTVEADWNSFLKYTRKMPVSVRFIELMRTRDRAEYRDQHFSGAGEMQRLLRSGGWKPVPRSPDSGPALEYRHEDHAGTIGLIAPHSEGFCESCNRLRVTSRGGLRLCLFGEEDLPLRAHLGSEKSAEALPGILQEHLRAKPERHFLQEGRTGLMNHFSTVGG